MRERTFTITDERQLGFALGFIPKQPLPLEVTVRPYKPQRSDSQNRRLWKLHGEASKVTGYTPEELHEEALCRHFGYTEQVRSNPWTGEMETKRVPMKRSSSRNKPEFAAFMEGVELFYGQTLGVWLE